MGQNRRGSTKESATRLLIAIETGALGNQLFQLAELVQLSSEYKVVMVGFDQLNNFLSPPERFATLPLLGVDRLVIRHRQRLVKGLTALPGVESLTESNCGEARRPTGPHILAVSSDNFFQKPVPEGVLAKLFQRINSDHLDVARKVVRGSCLKGETPVFLHVRRGDYVSWPSPSSSAALSDEWYISALRRLRGYVPNARVLVVSDDIPYCQHLLNDDPKTVIVGGDAYIDLAVMSLCKAGVLSASSFSWWGSAFAATQGAVGPFVAPQFWVGHNSESWFPEGIGGAHLMFHPGEAKYLEQVE